ncbi:MAG: F0F1 ATP synthase subunit alpha, partial [bacterium]|nr:F0F1 ATP synthase subunit alpha [bacterium]
YAGVRPAIHVGLSVSRVGGNAQIKAMKQVAGRLRLDLAQYRELEAFAKFSSELDKSTQAQLKRGEKMVEILKQEQNKTLPVERQIALIFLGTHGFLDEVPIKDIGRLEQDFYQFLETKYPQLLKAICAKKELDDDLQAGLQAACRDFMTVFRPDE